VERLFTKPERTEEVRQKLAIVIANCVKKNFPDAIVVCFIRPFDPVNGYAMR